MTRKYPDKLHFLNKFGERKFTLHYEKHEDMGDVWRCTYFKEEPQGWEAVYTQRNIEACFTEGEWIRIDEEGNEERLLQFPFEVEIVGGGVARVYEDMIDSTALVISHITGTQTLSQDYVRDSIKNGAWRVIRVGEQETSQKPSEAPTSDRDKGEPLVIKVEVKDAVKAIKELTEAFAELEDVVMRVDERMKRIFGGK